MTGKSFGGRLGVTGLALAFLFCGQPAMQPAAAQTPLDAQYVPAITALAGKIGTACATGTHATCGDGTLANAAWLNNPWGAIYDAYGNLFISDTSDDTIRRVDAITGIISTVVGVGSQQKICTNPTAATGACGDGGAAASGTLNTPKQIAFDAQGNLYIADYGDYRIRKITAVNGMITASCTGCTISTIAGNGTTGAFVAGSPTSTPIAHPDSVAADAAGDVFIGNSDNNQVLEIQKSTGTIALYAGSGSSSVLSTYPTNSPTTATFAGPYGLGLDSAGNLYISDHTNNVILMVQPAGSPATGITGPSTSANAMTIVAGSGTSCADSVLPENQNPCGDNGAATSATLDGPNATTFDAFGNMYIADNVDNRVRVVCKNCTANQVIAAVLASEGVTSPVSGNIYTIAGTGTAGSANNNYADLLSQIRSPSGVAFSPNGSQLAIATSSSGNAVRGVYMANAFPPASVGGKSAAQAISAQATNAGSVASFTFGTGLLADFGTGTPTNGVPTSGYATCPGPVSATNYCWLGLVFNPTAPGTRNSRVVLTDGNTPANQYILGLTGVGQAPAAAFLTGTITTFAGTGGTAGTTGDGSAANAALLDQPGSIALDATGNLFIADTANNKIRVVYAKGTLPNIGSPTASDIYTYAGTGTAGSAGDGSEATGAELSAPASISLDAAGNLYIADAANNIIREVSANTGKIATVAGNISGTICSSGNTDSVGDGCSAAQATLSNPQGVVSDPFGNLYIADANNYRIREVNASTGLMSTVAGTGAQGNGGSGVLPTSAALNGAKGVALDSYGNLYIADTGNNVVREICNNCASTANAATDALLTAEGVTTPVNGYIYTIAGNGTGGYSGDGGSATSAELKAPTGVWVDAAGDVYIADAGNSVIRMVSATGTISTVAGPGTPGVLGDGGLSTAAGLQSPSAVVADAAGNYYIADTLNDRVALVSSAPATSLAFGKVNQNSTSSTLEAALVNIGNQNLVLSGLTVSSSASISDYQQITGNSTDCSSTTTLVPGQNCQIRVTFTPSVAGSETGTVTISDNALNAPTTAPAQQTINLSGTEVVPGAPAAIAVAAGSAQTAAPMAPFSQALQALVTDANNSPVGNATVTFTVVPGSTGAGATFAQNTATTASNGIATAPALTANGTRGTFTVTASVTGVTQQATFTEAIAGNIAPTIALAANPPSPIMYGQNTTITATLTPVLNGTTYATGTVTFYDNNNQIGSPVTLASGAAAISYPSLPGAGAHSLTASYSGDSNFSASTTASPVTLVVTPLPVTASTASITLPYGSPLPAFGGTLVGVLSQDLAYVGVSFDPTPFSQTPDVGQYALNGQLTGTAAGNYTLTVTGNPTLTITQAPTTTAVSASNAQPTLGASVTLTATVASTVSGAPAPVGSVTFFDGATNLGTATLNAGTASISISTLLLGGHSVTAVYAGNTDNSGSTSTAITITVGAAQALGAQYVPVLSVSAGTGSAGYSGDGNAATSATLSSPWDVVYDAYGNLFISDSANNAIRRVDAVTGAITTVVGNGTACSPAPTTSAPSGGSGPNPCGDGGPATSATLSGPTEISFDPAGNLWIVDTGDERIREVQAVNGVITSTCTGCTIATKVGNGMQGSTTIANNTAPLSAALVNPRAVVVDAAGDIFFAQTGKNEIHVITTSTASGAHPGVIERYAGNNTTTPDCIAGVSYTCSPYVTPLNGYFAGPYYLSIDSAGNLYATDTTNNMVVKIAPGTGQTGQAPTTGIYSASTSTSAPYGISIVAGNVSASGQKGTAGYTGDNQAADGAELKQPYAAKVDAFGNLYIADYGNERIREVNAATGNITTIAGNGTQGGAGNGSAALQAELNNPAGVAVSPNGNQVAIASQSANTVQAIYIDNGFPATAVSGTTASAQNINVEALAGGEAASYQLVAGLPADFSVGTLTGCPGVMPPGAICSAPVTFNPTAPGTRNSRIVLTDSQNDKYILGLTGTGQAPAAAFMAGTISTFAGTGGTAGSTGDGSAATAALLSQPGSIALDANGNLYIADTANNKIRVVNPSASGTISTYAGTGTAGSQGDGAAATAARLNDPASISLDAAGNLYIADAANNRIREVSAQSGNISTVAGTGTVGATGDGAAATAATLSNPQGVVSDGFGNLYIADTGNNKIRKVNVYTGMISTVAGTGTVVLNTPMGVALDSAGNLYIADTGNNVVREVSNGTITTIAGTGAAGNSGDGYAASAAELSAPTGVWVDAAGDVYIADAGNGSIRMISAATGVITTVAGTNGTPGLAGDNGSSTAAKLQSPSAVVADAAGNYYIADTGNDRIAFVNAAAQTLAFGYVNPGTTSGAQTMTLENIGNQPLILSGLTFNPSAYQQVTGNPTDCTGATTLAPGASCQLRVTFTPAGGGPAPGTLTIADNALNASAATQTIQLTGIAPGALAAIAVEAGSNQTLAPNGSFSALVAQVADGSNYGVPGAQVTFTVLPGTTGAGATFGVGGPTTVTATTDHYGNATASGLIANLSPGTFTVTATVNTSTGVASATFNEDIEGKVAPTMTLSLGTASPITYGTSEAITATLTVPSGITSSPTGTVTFYNSATTPATVIGTASVNSGTATLPFTLGAATYSLTASYSGDTNFSVASTNAAPAPLTVTPKPITASTSSITLPYGSALPNPINGTLSGVLSQDQNSVSVTFNWNGTGSILSTPDVGLYQLFPQLSGSAQANYSVTAPSNPTLTVTPASTTTVVSASPMQAAPAAPVTLTANVSSQVTSGAVSAGSVTFYDASTSPATPLGTKNVISGIATLAVTTLSVGQHPITATFTDNVLDSQGLADYTGSNSTGGPTVSVVNSDFAFGVTSGYPTSATISQGGDAYVYITVTGNAAFTGTVSFSCASGLPAHTTCIFTPTAVTLPITLSNKTPTETSTVLLEIATAGPATAKFVEPFGGARTALAIIFLPGLLLIGLIRRRTPKGILGALLLASSLFLSLCAAGAVSGCSANNTLKNTVTTPAGATTVTINAQSGSITHTMTFSLNVTQPQ